VELTYNWPPEDGSPPEDYGSARNFGHLAFEVDDIYAICAHLQSMGVTINRPPRDGRMAFVRTPDRISIEPLQKGEALPPAEPWASMPNTGSRRSAHRGPAGARRRAAPARQQLPPG